jgi:hypothetical protein
MGHRSLAEMYAKEVLSEVEDGAAGVSKVHIERRCHIRVFVSYSMIFPFEVTLIEGVTGYYIRS